MGEGSQWHRDYELTWKNALSVISDNFFDKGKSMTAEQIQFEVLSYCTKILIPCTAEGGDETPAVEAPDATTTFVSNAPGSSLDPHPVHKGEFWRISGMRSIWQRKLKFLNLNFYGQIKLWLLNPRLKK